MLIAVIAVSLGLIGSTGDTASAGWCWIRTDQGCTKAVAWMLIAGKGWELLAYVSIALFCSLARWNMRSEVTPVGSALNEIWFDGTLAHVDWNTTRGVPGEKMVNWATNTPIYHMTMTLFYPIKLQNRVRARQYCTRVSVLHCKALSKRSSQLKPTRAKFTTSMELGIVWPPTWLALARVGTSWLEFDQAQVFAQLEPSFPPFGQVVLLLLCDYAVALRAGILLVSRIFPHPAAGPRAGFFKARLR